MIEIGNAYVSTLQGMSMASWPPISSAADATSCGCLSSSKTSAIALGEGDDRLGHAEVVLSYVGCYRYGIA